MKQMHNSIIIKYKLCNYHFGQEIEHCQHLCSITTVFLRVLAKMEAQADTLCLLAQIKEGQKHI